jgi:hypothetical protein
MLSEEPVRRPHAVLALQLFWVLDQKGWARQSALSHFQTLCPALDAPQVSSRAARSNNFSIISSTLSVV